MAVTKSKRRIQNSSHIGTRFEEKILQYNADIIAGKWNN